LTSLAGAAENSIHETFVIYDGTRLWASLRHGGQEGFNYLGTEIRRGGAPPGAATFIAMGKRGIEEYIHD
jgi:hypothetical protein